MATSGSDSRNVPAPTGIWLPVVLPAGSYWRATTLVSPLANRSTQVTTNRPWPSMATAGEPSSRGLELTTISGPVLVPNELYRCARMSRSLELNVSVQTTTEAPPAELALSDSNWPLRAVALTGPMNSAPSDISSRPSSDSTAGRRLRSWARLDGLDGRPLT